MNEFLGIILIYLTVFHWFRTHWSLQSEERVDGLAFAGMDKLEKKGHRSKVIKLKSDVSVLKDQVVQDINSLAQFHNQVDPF